MKISIAGNTSLTHYCAEMLCRKGMDISHIFLPPKVSVATSDIANFQSLAGEFDIELVNISSKSKADYETDFLIKTEWPRQLQLPVKARETILSSNLAGQFCNGRLLDIAADIYNGKKSFEIQLLSEEAGAVTGNTDNFNNELQFSKVIGYDEFELNHLDDLRSAKTKAMIRFYRLLNEYFTKFNPGGAKPTELRREISYSTALAERQIDWCRGAMYLHNLTRAYSNPGPGVFARYDDARIVIWRGRYFELSDNGFHDDEPGTIIEEIDELGLVVKTGHGSFLITRVQASGSPELPAWVWADQVHLKAGDKFQAESRES
jgi:hypothetical protein